MSIRTKSYNEAIAGFESGLKQLENLDKDPNVKSYKRDRIKINIEVQKARIQAFKEGYNLAKKEMKEQRLLCVESLQK